MSITRTQEVAFNTIRTGTQSVASAGTAESLTTSNVYTRVVIIRAKHTNVGAVYIGDSGVSSSNGYPLLGGESTPPMPIDNLKNVYVDAANNNDGVDFMYFHNQ